MPDAVGTGVTISPATADVEFLCTDSSLLIFNAFPSFVAPVVRTGRWFGYANVLAPQRRRNRHRLAFRRRLHLTLAARINTSDDRPHCRRSGVTKRRSSASGRSISVDRATAAPECQKAPGCDEFC